MNNIEKVKLKEGIKIFIDPVTLWYVKRNEPPKPLPVRHSYWIKRALQKGILIKV
jgi:hypothetical protein